MGPSVAGKEKQRGFHHQLPIEISVQDTAAFHELIGSLSPRVFEIRAATGSDHFACQDSGVSQIFIFIISNGERILNNVNVVV